MAHNLKLNIWSLRFEKKDTTKSYKRLNICDTLCHVNDVDIKDYNIKIKNDLFKGFVKFYVTSFNDKFINDVEDTKAFTYDDIKIDSSKNIIFGSIKGGITGIEQDVYLKGSKNPTKKKISKDEVSTLPYHFLIWMPVDSDIAYLMTQSYTNVSINQVFLEHFAYLFKTKDIRIQKDPKVSEERLKTFYKSSYVYKVTLFKRKLSKNSREKFNTVFMEENNVNLSLSFTGFRVKVKKFFDQWSSIESNLKDFAIENENDYDLMVYYENEDKKKASASIDNPKVILPSIFIPDSVKKNGSDNPDTKKLYDFCLKELVEIKADINYTPL